MKEFPYSGVSAEIPAATDLQWVRDSGRAYIGMHAAVWPPWSPGDPQLLLEITLERMSREKFEEPGAAVKQSASYQEGDEETRRFWDWVVSRHETIERYDFKGHTYFKYEITCADATLVRIDAELINLLRDGVPVYEAEDEAAIRRVLNSGKCIEQVAMPERPREKVPEEHGE
ncbi:MAG: hypothetical protein WBH85_13370 [Thermoanaerobaculia bacterium]